MYKLHSGCSGVITAGTQRQIIKYSLLIFQGLPFAVSSSAVENLFIMLNSKQKKFFFYTGLVVEEVMSVTFSCF